MIIEFFYNGPLGTIGVRYSDRDWVFLIAVILLGLVLLAVTSRRESLVEKLLEVLRTFGAALLRQKGR
jgi:hypothetical protein